MSRKSYLQFDALVQADSWELFSLAVVDATLNAFDASRVFLILPDVGEPRVHAQAVAGQRALSFAEPQLPESFFGLPVDELEWQLNKPEISIRPIDYQAAEIWDDTSCNGQHRYRLLLPLVSQGRLACVLYVEFTSLAPTEGLVGSASFRRECEALAALVAERWTTVLDGQSRSLDEMTGRLQASLARAEDYRGLLQRLHQVTLRLAEAPDLDALYHRAVTLGLAELDIDRMAIFEANDERNEMRGTYGTDNNGEVIDERWFISPLPQHKMLDESRRRPGEVVVNEDAALYYDKIVVGRGWNAMIGLWIDDRMIGWIAADNFLRRRPLQPYQREVLKLFASIVSQFIGNKQVEAEMLALNARLSQQTQELASARDEAEAASHAKSAFLATISHEIRTPLNGMLGFLQLLGDTPLTLDQRDFVETIAQSGDTLMSLINDLLDYSKIESGKFTLESRPFDLRVVTAEVCTMLAARAAEKRLDLLLDVKQVADPGYLGDAVRFKQVLVNLIGNALKFTDRGQVSVQLSTGEEGELRVVVTDTGQGIASDKQSSLFQRFFQAESGSTRRHGGTGLGLAISKLLVELMGGRIGVHTVPGAGSSFWFTLPANVSSHASGWGANWLPAGADTAFLAGRRFAWLGPSTYRRNIEAFLCDCGVEWVDPHSAQLVIADEAYATDIPADKHRLLLCWSAGVVARPGERRLKKPVIGYGVLIRQLYALLVHPLMLEARPLSLQPEPMPLRRILLAEDSPVNQRVIEVFLNRLGHEVAIAANGAEALKLAASQRFDLVLMDWQMPVMDGIEATRRLRADPVSRHWPIIALTANANQDSEQMCRDAGMNAFLPKPVDLGRLQSLLRELLGKTEPVAWHALPS
ncbi:ATP-binding protein [Jeongeupia naejangsanensis]|uniref:histidine kinase n=1 Tax=Jeongeupia naejangsanensis TaxID=613195 RepID=A0ABS2BMM6_9NEIS|nr:ATP-binding protein [Jeongeupia naejangsanensis]MBM3116877.1 response regulator [Jeongeupia naejangsanensis]